jgi:ferrous iron transport protein A
MGVVAAAMALVKLPRGRRALVADVCHGAPADAGLASRLRELGFVDGEDVEVLASAVAGGPLAVRIGESTFALRRAEAQCVLVHRRPE